MSFDVYLLGRCPTLSHTCRCVFKQSQIRTEHNFLLDVSTICTFNHDFLFFLDIRPRHLPYPRRCLWCHHLVKSLHPRSQSFLSHRVPATKRLPFLHADGSRRIYPRPSSPTTWSRDYKRRLQSKLLRHSDWTGVQSVETVSSCPETGAGCVKWLSVSLFVPAAPTFPNGVMMRHIIIIKKFWKSE